ncbi:hypothetical protein PMZ80_009051 [Knufia obscura]|uniref:Beta-xylosidase C-terminal Concanavalin A-like domain-containing protein n=1 Tax=Knufia obscura TaxID=1635080 RepID=A0ABR0RFG8_9EURO|nr:hypothetical protein PMZ80_009051 [Knufia obscura]
MSIKTFSLWLLSLHGVLSAALPRNTSYTNPILPGHHSDPSCTSVGDTFYCVTSTFNLFPGLPVYASKDLINWKHVSNALHREDQYSGYLQIQGQQDGIYAPTLRHHDGIFYIIVAFQRLQADGETGFDFLIFNSTDPYDPELWDTPIVYNTPDLGSFDNDIFFDDDGQAYVTVHVTGEYGDNYNLWNGTGNIWPEGPHMYKKDGYYYLTLAEGGTGPNHQVTVARSEGNIRGPYEAYENNPILTNANTTQYFQAVGHADIFQDQAGNWWATALSIRGGPDNQYYPMGRETVLTPVKWDEGGWPQPEPVRGHMTGPLPPPSRDVGGEQGVWLKDGDNYETFNGPNLPLHFIHYLFPPHNLYSIADGRLRVNPTTQNLTGVESFNASTDRVALIARRQTDTLFTYGVTMDFSPTAESEEAGITLFLSQNQHADLGIVMLDGSPQVRFRITGIGAVNPYETETLAPLDPMLRDQPLRLEMQAVSETSYVFYYGAEGNDGPLQTIGMTDASLVSGGNGSFVGSYVGVYASSNGGSGRTPAYYTNWIYEGQGQMIDYNEMIES